MNLSERIQQYDWKDLYDEQYGNLSEEEASPVSSVYLYKIEDNHFFTLDEAAEYSGYSRSYLSKMLNGYADNVANIERI